MNPILKTPQLVNFCQEPLTKLVECTVICADNYPVENLISQNAFQRQKGFRVEHFIRPPVHLEFHFLAPISIACVAVKPDLAEGREVNMSVFTATHYTSQQYMKMCGQGRVRGEGAVLVMTNRVFERRHWCKVELSSFASVLASHVTHTDLLNITEEPLKDVFNVRRLKLSLNYFSGPRPVSLRWIEVWGTLGVSGSGSEDILRAHTAIACLGTQSDEALNATLLPVAVPVEKSHCRETQFVGGGMEDAAPGTGMVRRVGALQHLREVGKEASLLYMGPLSDSAAHANSRSCGSSSALDQGTFNNLGVLSKQNSKAKEVGMLDKEWSPHQSSPNPGGVVQHSIAASSTHSSTKKKTTTILPDRFLDEITCELMSLPMLLPSGHYVDRSTLDKLRHADSTYGRPPSDPFTGVAFSEHARPQFSVELKQQIDSFLSSSQDESATSSHGRTLGSASEIAKHLVAIQNKVERQVRSKAVQKQARWEDVSDSDEVCLPRVKKQKQPITERGEDLETLTRPLSSAHSQPSFSLRDNRSIAATTVKEDHGRMCLLTHELEGHELEVASSLDRELKDLFHS